MTALQNLRKTITDPTPLYAAVGVADIAVARVRTASDEADQKVAELREQLKPELIVTKAQEAAAEYSELVQTFPKRLEEQGKAAFAQAEESYSGLSKRGEGVVAELRKQQQKQVELVVEQGKATVADVRQTARETQARAAKTVLVGRKEAAKQVEAAADVVESAASKVESEARTEVRSTAARAGQITEKPAVKKAPARKTTAKKAPAKSPAKKPTTTA